MSKDHTFNDLFTDFPTTCSLSLSESFAQMVACKGIKSVYEWITGNSEFQNTVRTLIQQLSPLGLTTDQITAITLITRSFGSYSLRGLINAVLGKYGAEAKELRIFVLCVYGGLLKLGSVNRGTPFYYMIQNRKKKTHNFAL